MRNRAVPTALFLARLTRPGCLPCNRFLRHNADSTCGVVGRQRRRCMRSGALLAKNIPPFIVWCRVTVGLLQPSGGVRSSR